MHKINLIADKSFVSKLDASDQAFVNACIFIVWRIVRSNYSTKKKQKNRDFLERSPFIPILSELYGIPEDQMLNFFLLKNEFAPPTHH